MKLALILLGAIALCSCNNEPEHKGINDDLNRLIETSNSLDEVCRTDLTLGEYTERGFKFSCDDPGRSARYFVWQGQWKEVFMRQEDTQ